MVVGSGRLTDSTASFREKADLLMSNKQNLGLRKWHHLFWLVLLLILVVCVFGFSSLRTAQYAELYEARTDSLFMRPFETQISSKHRVDAHVSPKRMTPDEEVEFEQFLKQHIQDQQLARRQRQQHNLDSADNSENSDQSADHSADHSLSNAIEKSQASRQTSANEEFSQQDAFAKQFVQNSKKQTIIANDNSHTSQLPLAPASRAQASQPAQNTKLETPQTPPNSPKSPKPGVSQASQASQVSQVSDEDQSDTAQAPTRTTAAKRASSETEHLQHCIAWLLYENYTQPHASQSDGTPGVSHLICEDLIIPHSFFTNFDEIFTFHPWYYYTIISHTSTTTSNTHNIANPGKTTKSVNDSSDLVRVNVWKRWHPFEYDAMKLLAYVQYVPSRLSHYGVSSQIWSDHTRRCLYRFVGSLAFILHAEFSHSFLQQPFQRFSPSIPCWVHVDESNVGCRDLSDKWQCYFLPVFVQDSNPFLFNSTESFDSARARMVRMRRARRQSIRLRHDAEGSQRLLAEGGYELEPMSEVDIYDMTQLQDPYLVSEFFESFLSQNDPHDVQGRRRRLLLLRSIFVTFLMRPKLDVNVFVFDIERKLLRRMGGDAEKGLERIKNGEERCVALHVRRGDKIDWCQSGFDRGSCTFNVTFGEYMEKTRDMIQRLEAQHMEQTQQKQETRGRGTKKIRNVVLLTDDPNVCRSDKMAGNDEYKDVRFYCVDGNGQMPDFGTGSGERGADKEKNWFLQHRTVEFAKILISLRWGSLCDGFVGNFDSNVAGLIYLEMCHRTHECPPYYSFGMNKEVKLSWG